MNLAPVAPVAAPSTDLCAEGFRCAYDTFPGTFSDYAIEVWGLGCAFVSVRWWVNLSERWTVARTLPGACEIPSPSEVDRILAAVVALFPPDHLDSGVRPRIERDAVNAAYRVIHRKNAPRKADLDALVAPLVAAGVLAIRKVESLIKGCPGGHSRPPTTVRTSYVLIRDPRCSGPLPGQFHLPCRT